LSKKVLETVRSTSNLEIVNVVATADLGRWVDLVQISQLEHTTYDTEIYGGRVAYLKTPEMHGKITIFSSGKLISVGTRSPHEAQKDLETTVETLVENGLIDPVRVMAEVRNIVAVLNLGAPVDLEELAEKVDGIYEPEQFPRLILKQSSPRATYLVFASGKVVIAGSRSPEEIKQAAKKIQKIIQKEEVKLLR